MLPDIWGECGWKFLHLVTLDYPIDPTEDQQKKYYTYFHALQYVLPCDKCRYNMSHHLKKFPLTEEVLSSRTNLVRWGIDLHNVVNYYLGKPMLTYAEAINELNKLTNPPKPTNEIWYYLLGLVAVFMVVYLIYYYIYKK